MVYFQYAGDYILNLRKGALNLVNDMRLLPVCSCKVRSVQLSILPRQNVRAQGSRKTSSSHCSRKPRYVVLRINTKKIQRAPLRIIGNRANRRNVNAHTNKTNVGKGLKISLISGRRFARKEWTDAGRG